MTTFDLICLGCGPAGEKAASQAAYYNRRVAVIEKAALPGGAMVNTGTIPSKALRESALLCSALNRRPLPGLGFDIDRNLSVPRFMAQRLLIEEQEHDRIERSMDRHRIDVFHGHGRLVDPNTVDITHEDGTVTTLRGKHILVAAGSRPVRPGHVPFDTPVVVDADGVLELDQLPDSMIIVGGGVIGCEYASIFAEINVHVTLVHPGPSILPFIDSECRACLERAMRDQGIELLLDTSVETVDTPVHGGVRVSCTDARTLSADIILWAAGRQPNTDDIGLTNVGLETDERGRIAVDEHYRTSVPSIYAAGDVIGFPALAATSMEQGRIAACAMFGLEFKRRIARNMTIGIYTIPGISTVGMTEEQAVEAGHDVVIGRARYRDNVRGRMLGDEQGLLKCIFDADTRCLLGATIVGEDATELIHLAQSVLLHDEGINYFIDACFNYPSLTELYTYAAYSALQELATREERDDEMGLRAMVA
jgi:NAD(P) transhydrogenase